MRLLLSVRIRLSGGYQEKEGDALNPETEGPRLSCSDAPYLIYERAVADGLPAFTVEGKEYPPSCF